MKKEKKPTYSENGTIENITSEKDYRKAKARLETLQRNRSWKTLGLFFAFFVFILSFAFYFGLFDPYSGNTKDLLISILLSVLSAAFIIIYMCLIVQIAESGIQSKINAYEAENIKDDVVEDIFENSIRMSYKYLDQYYHQTKEQAQKGFFVTMFVAGFGAILIAGGITAMYFGLVEPSYITCGAGVITEFISAVFFYLYNKTVSSMSRYHNKLVLSHNVSIALKVAEALPTDNQTEAKNLIISELLKNINSLITKDDSSGSDKK